MKNSIRYLPALLALTGALLLATAAAPKDPQARLVARGRYLATIAGCHDCHTPRKFGPQGPVPDFTRALSGHPESVKLPPPPDLANSPWFAATAGMTAWAGPWGVSYAANLTPDRNTGLGIWTENMFVAALRTGKHMGSGRDILPPMPWQNAALLADEDLKALFAYLQSLPAIANRVPEPRQPNGSTYE